MHTIKNGKLVPDRCSGYPFCDWCAPPRKPVEPPTDPRDREPDEDRLLGIKEEE